MDYNDSNDLAWGGRMTVKRLVKPNDSSPSIPLNERSAAKLAEIGQAVRDIEQQYELEIAKIQADFAVFEAERRMEYERHETDFGAALQTIEDEYAALFHMLDADQAAGDQKRLQDLAQEDEKYLGIVKDFQTIQNEAFAKYQELSRKAATAIDKEAQIHRIFVDGEERRFEDIKHGYTMMNDEQYEQLLRAMDSSKNMLDQLARDLSESAFNDAKFLSQAILQILENLRDTKNKITALFKTTTSVYAAKKKKIDELSAVRQKPHSVLNQTLIDQFVRQIATVEKDKASFDRIVNRELEESKSIIGKKIIDADARGKRAETEKYIMMYEIVIAKATFLLKRNQRMSDLLISKYQTEIHKIKVDSFRRVEEVKLAYYMPSQFYQNSINLYSNYAFFINESFDEIDNMLSDFIRFNQSLTQTRVQYLQTSAKVFADFKVDLLVTVNAVTAKLSELITDIDRVSTDIISLESKNRLEVADVKKQMENAEITGDYHKYLKGLEFDRFFADYQHDLNTKTIQADDDQNSQLLQIERKATAANRERRIEGTRSKRDRALVMLEKEIHDQALDKQFVLAEAAFRRDAALIDQEAKRQTAEVIARTERTGALYDAAYREQEQILDVTRADGSATVVDYVKKTQKLIDLHHEQTAEAKAYVAVAEDRYKRAYLLDAERDRALRALDAAFMQDTAAHRKAIDYYHHYAYVANRHLIGRADRYLSAFGRLLVDLRPETVPLQVESLKLAGFYRYEILSTFEDGEKTLAEIARRADLHDLASKTTEQIEGCFARYAILSSPTADERFAAQGDKRRLRNLERFYVDAILVLRDYEYVVDGFFDSLLNASITRDVLVVDGVRRAIDRKKRIVDDHFDREIYHAARRPKKTDDHLSEIEAADKTFEAAMTERVYRLNRSYEDGVGDERHRLAYVRKALDADLKSVRRSARHEIARIERNRLATHQLAKIRFDKLVAAYEDLKLQLHDNMEAENRAIDAGLAEQETAIKARLESLATAVQALPAKKQERLATLEADKQALVVARKKILEAELSELESLKFNARPMFIAKIQGIRDRLPQDYVDLYKRMAESQDAYVREHRTTEQAFDAAFQRFIANQKDYEAIIGNDAVVMHPFDRQIEVAERILRKTDDAFGDSMAKAEAAREQVKTRTADSESTQKRILNE